MEYYSSMDGSNFSRNFWNESFQRDAENYTFFEIFWIMEIFQRPSFIRSFRGIRESETLEEYLNRKVAFLRTIAFEWRDE